MSRATFAQSAANGGAGPWPLVTAAMVGLQGVVALAFAVFYVLEQSRAFSQFNVLASAGLFVLGGLGLLAVARGLWQRRRWARSPALTWQIICLPVAVGLFQSGRWPIALPLAVSVALTLRGLFANPPTPS